MSEIDQVPPEIIPPDRRWIDWHTYRPISPTDAILIEPINTTSHVKDIDTSISEAAPKRVVKK